MKQADIATLVVQAEHSKEDNAPHIAPIYQTSTFTFGSTAGKIKLVKIVRQLATAKMA